MSTNPHRLKGLYLDYRFFDAQKEVTNFRRACNQLAKEFDDAIVREVSRKLRERWDQVPDMQKWHGWKFAEIVDLFFNASL